MVNLRKLTEEDLDFVLDIRNDFSTRNNLENNLVFSIEECKSWFEKNNPKWFIINSEGISVGYFRTNGATIGCDIHPKFRRRGFAREAFLEYLEDKSYADLWVFEDNFAIDLYSSLGFVRTGESKKIRNRDYIRMEWVKRG